MALNQIFLFKFIPANYFYSITNYVDTKLNDLYGTYSIKKEYLDGSLVYSLKKD